MQQATTVSLQLGFSGPPEGILISPNPIETKEESVEGLGGFEPPTCGLGNRCSIHLSYSPSRVLSDFFPEETSRCTRPHD